MWYLLTAVPGVVGSLIVFILYQRKAARVEQLLNHRNHLAQLLARVDEEKRDAVARRDALIARYERELDDLEKYAPKDVASVRERLRRLLQAPAHTDDPDIVPDKPTAR